MSVGQLISRLHPAVWKALRIFLFSLNAMADHLLFTQRKSVLSIFSSYYPSSLSSRFPGLRASTELTKVRAPSPISHTSKKRFASSSAFLPFALKQTLWYAQLREVVGNQIMKPPPEAVLTLFSFSVSFGLKSIIFNLLLLIFTAPLALRNPGQSTRGRTQEKACRSRCRLRVYFKCGHHSTTFSICEGEGEGRG